MNPIGIIGGGASGIVAAIAAARSDGDAQVFILEQKENIGKKILATGNGRCNLTNEAMDASCYHGEDPEFARNVLKQFGYGETLEFFASLGLFTKSRGGYIYPRSDQAASVLELLEMELRRQKVKIYTGVRVEARKLSAKGLVIRADGQRFPADRVILACGGKASKSLGSDGSGYALARSMGHTLSPVVPALVQLKVKKHPFAKAAGVRTDAKVAALLGRQVLAEDTGEMQITAYGISGIPVFQISRHIAKGLYEGKEMKVRVDFLPEMEASQVRKAFNTHLDKCPYATCQEFLTGIFPKKLIPRLLELSHIRQNFPASELKPAQWEDLIRACKQTLLTIEDTNGFDNAQVCAGGVRTGEVYPDTLESRYADGLYLTGELLDVEGICGGYNLQWAWATGYLAGRAAAERP